VIRLTVAWSVLETVYAQAHPAFRASFLCFRDSGSKKSKPADSRNLTPFVAVRAAYPFVIIEKGTTSVFHDIKRLNLEAFFERAP
jgi:hypothetical protein